MADIHFARHISLSPGSIITMDRAYNDYQLFASWTESGIYFVTRLNDNANYEVVENFETPQNRNILSDQLIRFTGYRARKNPPSDAKSCGLG